MRLAMGFAFLAAVSCLSACGASREKVSLAYAGDDARNTTDALSAAISDAGFSPNCRDRKFCKFKFNDQATVHYKLTKRDPILLVEVRDDVEETERFSLEAEVTKQAQEIWRKSSAVTLEKEESDKQAAAERKEKQAALDVERHKVDTAAQLERERIELERQRVSGEQVAAAEQKAAADAKVTETIGFEPKGKGAALKVELPEGAVCTTISDNSAQSKSLEVPFQIETMPGAFYTVECALPSGSGWRKKIQTKERFVTVVKLRQGL